MNNLKYLQSMSIEEFTDWLDNYRIDDAPWLLWWDETYCKYCEPIKVESTEAEKKLGIRPFYNETFDCAYCELTEDGVYRCKYFPELDHVPTSREMIGMWLEAPHKEKAGPEWVECNECLYNEDCLARESRDGCYTGEKYNIEE